MLQKVADDTKIVTLVYYQWDSYMHACSLLYEKPLTRTPPGTEIDLTYYGIINKTAEFNEFCLEWRRERATADLVIQCNYLIPIDLPTKAMAKNWCIKTSVSLFDSEEDSNSCNTIKITPLPS